MELAVFLPPIAVTLLLSFYRDKILCFWNCQSSTDLSIHTSPLLSFALSIKNTTYALVTVIQRILVTLQTTLQTSFQAFLRQAANHAHYLKNTALSLFQPTPKPDSKWILWILVAIVLVWILGRSIYEFQEFEEFEISSVEEGPIRKPIRRKGKKVD